MIDREDLERAYRLLDEGRASFRDLESKLGIPKSTLHRWYIKRLDERIEERRRVLADLEQSLSKLREEYFALKREVDAIEATFKLQGITLKEAVKIVKNIRDLRAERDSLKNEVARLKVELAGWRDRLNKLKSRLSALEGDEKMLIETLSEYYSQLDYYQRLLPQLKQEERQLRASIKALRLRQGLKAKR